MGSAGVSGRTSRGFREAQFRQVADWIARIVESDLDDAVIAAVAEETQALCSRYPMP